MKRALGSVLLGWLALALLVPAPLEAQRRSQDRRGGSQDRARLEQRIRARMGEMTRERLGLSEEQATLLAEVVERFDGERRELFREERAIRREVEDVVRGGSDDQQAASELVDRMIEHRAREARLFAEEQAALLEVLTPVQLLELQELREELGRRIRALRGGRRGNDSRGRSGDRPRRSQVGGSGPGALALIDFGGPGSDRFLVVS